MLGVVGKIKAQKNSDNRGLHSEHLGLGVQPGRENCEVPSDQQPVEYPVRGEPSPQDRADWLLHSLHHHNL